MTKTQRAKQDRFNNLMSRFMIACKLNDEPTMEELVVLLVSGPKANEQARSMRWTTKGDFSHLHANPLICK